MLEKTKAVQGPLGGRVEEGTSKGSTAAVLSTVERESHQSAPISRFQQKATEGERGEKDFQNDHLRSITDQQKATEKPNQENQRNRV